METVEYPYFFGVDCLDLIFAELVSLDTDLFIVVTDDTVLNIHGRALLDGLRSIARVEVLSHEPGEAMKSTSVLAKSLERTFEFKTTRRSVVVALGGGVPGNLAGLIAALLFRGVRLVHIPTTTMAAMDSVLSLKQAINSHHGKNHIGTFLAPQAVYLDASLLTTLPDREMKSGLCEAVKNSLAIAPSTLPKLQQILHDGTFRSPESLLWLLKISIAAKQAVTKSDSRESGTGLVLEYGHTVGHAVELCSHRNPEAETLSHGASIAFGMLVAAHISHARGWLSSDIVDLHENIVRRLAPTRLPASLRVDDVLAVLCHDNKRGYIRCEPGSVAFVLLEDLGKPAGEGAMPLVPVELGEVEAVLRRLSASNAELR